MGGDELPKLVRDRIPEVIRENGQEPVTRQLEDGEVAPFLKEKVREEAGEFADSGEPEELADLLQVIERYLEVKDVDREEVEELMNQKNMERGGFSGNIVLEDVKG